MARRVVQSIPPPEHLSDNTQGESPNHPSQTSFSGHSSGLDFYTFHPANEIEEKEVEEVVVE